MKKTKVEKLNLSPNTHCQLKYLSKICGLSMTEIVRQIMNELTSLSVNFRKATLSVDSRITENTCYIVLHGAPIMLHGDSPTDQDMIDEMANQEAQNKKLGKGI
ncbi:hypothetical protein MUO79_01810 [Candidatus Bathyarchaeota archaeon]|nr:hypothetical protein [Candidatus Bathyarchaeota archaeon]